MCKTLYRKSLPLLLLASFFQPMKARAVDPITLATGSAIAAGAIGCGTYLYLRSVRRKASAQDRLDSVVQLLMALRGSQNLELSMLLKTALATHAGDLAKIESLFINQYHDDQTLIARLKWQLPLMEPRRKPDLLAWLEFEELASARETWQQLQAIGWKVTYADPDQPPIGTDSMFLVEGSTRKLTVCTTPYLISGPVMAMWATFSAEAAEKAQSHSAKIRAWAAALRNKYRLNDSEAVVANLVMQYLHKSATWTRTAAVYHSFVAAHPEHKSWLWDGHLFDSKSERSRNLHVLSTLGVLPLGGLKDFVEELVGADLDRLIAAP